MSDSVFEEIRAERRRQDEKWDEQNHPMLGKHRNYVLANENFPSELALKETLSIHKTRNETDKRGWFDILIEEVCEAFLETEPEKQREKMVQAAAVAVAIIECLDRRINSEGKRAS